MRLLVDTHVLLWALAQPERLSSPSRQQLIDPANEVLFSAASIWEIAIKAQIGRLTTSVRPESIARAALEVGFAELPISAAHAAGVSALPLHHRDPFDRLLIAQAMHEPARLLTADRQLAAYSELVVVLA